MPSAPSLRYVLGAVLALVFVLSGGSRGVADDATILESLRGREEATWTLAHRIWELAEPGYQEKESSALLAKMLEEAGFKVERGVAAIPTAFIANYGSGTPVIAILGEFDALPGLSQAAVPIRQPREDANSYGHACGHHLFGAASATAAITIAEEIKAGRLQGTIRYYGCPAEEGGAAKCFLVRAGLFDDCSAVLHWHPSNRNVAGDRSTLARIAAKFRFRGKAAHAAGAPEEGRSALDAVELMNHAAQLLREHTPDGSRIHHVITDGGAAPNIVPETAEVYYYVRHPNSAVVRDLYRRLELCAQAGALATETKLEVEYLGGTVEILPNQALSQVVLEHLEELNDLSYTDEERQFAVRIQATLAQTPPLEQIEEVFDESGQTGSGSTDVGDVSWRVPTCGFSTACWIPGTPGHSWQATACGGTSFARKGMNLAARVLAMTAADFLQNPETLATARQELDRRLEQQAYEPLIGKTQKPPLDYRNPARGRIPTE